MDVKPLRSRIRSGWPKTSVGCQTDIYTWIQTIREVEVRIPVVFPNPCHISDVEMVIQENQVQIGVRGYPAIINGTLFSSIKVHEVLAFLDNNDIILNMPKATVMEKWSSLMLNEIGNNGANATQSLLTVQDKKSDPMTVEKDGVINAMGLLVSSPPKCTDAASQDPLKEYNPRFNQMKRLNIKFCPWQRGKPIPSKCKQLVANVYYKLATENPAIGDDEVIKRVASLVGIGTVTIRRLKTEYRNHGKASTPGKRRPKSVGQRTRMQIYDDYTLCSIRKLVHDLYRQNEAPTLPKITRVINDSDELPNMCRATVQRILQDLNFKSIKVNHKNILIDRDDIVDWRRRYLRQMKVFRTERRNIVYVDETWINVNHTVNQVQEDATKSEAQTFNQGITTGLKQPNGKGEGLIILDAGGEQGFVPGCTCILYASNGKSDYHEDIDGSFFEDWFSTSLLPNLPPQSVIVMDNASCHCVKKDPLPTKAWRRDEIRTWLKKRNITWEKEMIKSELLDRAIHLKHVCEDYVVDCLARNAGHTVIRLPPYHYELCAIKKVWSYVREHIALENQILKLPAVRAMAQEAIAKITPELWASYSSQVVLVEAEMWKVDSVVEDFIDKVMISLESSSSSNDDSDLDESIEPLSDSEG